MASSTEIKLKLIIDGKEANAALQITDENIKELYKSFKYGKTEVNGLTTAISQGFNNAREIIQGFKEAYGVIKNAFAEPIRASVSYEEAETAFSVLLGSGEKAKTMIKDLQEYGAKTPLELPSLLENTKMLLNFGLAAKDVMPTLKMLGDVSGGNADRLRSLTLAYAQIQSTGRLMGQDLLQLINAGFNPLQVISEKTGKSIGQLKKEMEGGSISAQMVTEAFKDVTSEGGKFYGMLEKQSGTLGGKISNLNDSLTRMKTETGNIIGIVLGPLIVTASDLIGKLNELSPALSGAIGLAATLTTAFVTLQVTGIGGTIKSIITGIIPAITALKTSLITLQFSLGPVGWLTLGLTAIAGLWLSISAGQEKAAETLKTYESHFKSFRLKAINAELNKTDIEPTKKWMLEKERTNLLGSMLVSPHKVKEEASSTGETTDLTKEKYTAEQKAKIDFEYGRLTLIQYQQYLNDRLNALRGATYEEKQLIISLRKELEQLNEQYHTPELQSDNFEMPEDKILDDVVYGDTNDYARLSAQQEIDIWREKELAKVSIYENSDAMISAINDEYARKNKDLKDAEIEIAQATEQAKIESTLGALNLIGSAVAQHTLLGKAVAVAQTSINTYEAASKALTAGPIIGPVLAGIITALGLDKVYKIMATETPSFKGYEKGGIVVGEKGPEIIAPMQDYATGQAQLVNEAVMAVERRMMALTFSEAGGSYNRELVEEMKRTNKRIDELLQVPIVLDDSAVQKIYERGRKLSGYRT